MRHLTIVMPYYDNPGMLEHHYNHWKSPAFDRLRDWFDVVIVDDGSPGTPAATVDRPTGLPVTIYRVLIDRLWHQHAARNIGAHHAKGPWLFMTDMDHMLPAGSMRRIIGIKNANAAYTFHRLDALDDGFNPRTIPKLKNGQPHPHVNTFLIRKDRYWEIGGYDEDYCGFYGTDGHFRKRMWHVLTRVHLDGVPVVRYPREIIPDSSVPGDVPRKEGRPPNFRKVIADKKKQQGTAGVPKTLSMPYIRAWP